MRVSYIIYVNIYKNIMRGVVNKMARPKRSIANEPKPVRAARPRRPVAGGYMKRKPVIGGYVPLKGGVTKEAMRARAAQRRKDKSETATHGLLPDPIGEKKDCRKVVVSNCARTKGCTDKVRKRSYRVAGGIKMCRAKLAPPGGHVACQTKTRTKHGMPEKYSVLINKKNKGGDSVKKNRKRKRTKGVSKKVFKSLMDELQDKVDARFKARVDRGEEYKWG